MVELSEKADECRVFCHWLTFGEFEIHQLGPVARSQNKYFFCIPFNIITSLLHDIQPDPNIKFNPSSNKNSDHNPVFILTLRIVFKKIKKINSRVNLKIAIRECDPAFPHDCRMHRPLYYIEQGQAGHP